MALNSKDFLKFQRAKDLGEDNQLLFAELKQTQNQLANLNEQVKKKEKEEITFEIDPKDIKGDKGDKGDTGEQGKMGSAGPEGPEGATGEPGQDGKTGNNGIDGKNGKDGERGLQGPEGLQGLAPQHEWEETKLRFQKPNKTWGAFVDLQGRDGLHGGGGGGIRISKQNGKLISSVAKGYDFQRGIDATESRGLVNLNVDETELDHGLLQGLADDDHPQYILKPLNVDFNFFVATTGSDLNNGLTAGTPFLTIQHAYDVSAGIRSNEEIVINIADGTYTEQIVIPNGGVGMITLKGNTTTPGNVILDAAGPFTNTVIFSSGNSVTLAFNGITFKDGLFGVHTEGQRVIFDFVRFENCFFGVFGDLGTGIVFRSNVFGNSVFVGPNSPGTGAVFLSNVATLTIGQDLTITRYDQGLIGNFNCQITVSFGTVQSITLSTGGGFGGILVRNGSTATLFGAVTIDGSVAIAGGKAIEVFAGAITTVFNGVFTFKNIETGIDMIGNAYVSASPGTFTYTNVTTPVKSDYSSAFSTPDNFDTIPQFDVSQDQVTPYDQRAFYQRMMFN